MSTRIVAVLAGPDPLRKAFLHSPNPRIGFLRVGWVRQAGFPQEEEGEEKKRKGRQLGGGPESNHWTPTLGWVKRKGAGTVSDPCSLCVFTISSV